MNKIQKILWSIFSGLICMIYKPSYGVVGWYHHGCNSYSISGYCTNPADRSNYFSKYGCRTISSGILSGQDCNSDRSDVRILNSSDSLSYIITSIENACEQHYYQNTPTCSACTTAPINGVDEIALSMLYGPAKKYTAIPYLDGYNERVTNIFVNVCTPTGSDQFTFCFYQASDIFTLKDELGSETECYVVPGTAQYSDQTGTYSYKDTACEYTE